MTGPHSTKARQRNDRDLAANADRIEGVQAKIDALTAELADLQTEQRALLAMGTTLRGDLP